MAKTIETVEAGLTEHDAHHEPGVLDPNTSMVLLTWFTFFLLLGVLYKFAWKPILNALDTREKHLRDAIENADKIENELTQLDQKKKEIIEAAEMKSKEIIGQARKAAQEAAHTVERNAKEEAQIILENARRDIKEEVEKAQAMLQEESAIIAVRLASKIIEENLDSEKNKKLINRIIKDI